MANKKVFGNTNIYSATSMTFDMFEIGVEDGYLPSADNFPNIPELMSRASECCLKMFNDINRWNDEENPNKYDAITMIGCAERMCFFVGMGAVYLWNMDWNTLSKKGIYESLCAPRGYFYLDEYVMHLAGAEFGSEEGKALAEHCHRARISMLPCLTEQKTAQDILEQVVECLMAMYYYGMVIGMSNLGMH